MKSVLHLTLHREWFAAIAAGTKRIEYRAQTPYWRKRLEGRQYDVIRFRNGHARNAPEMQVEFRGLRRYGRGPNACYAIRLGRILHIKRWKPGSHDSNRPGASASHYGQVIASLAHLPRGLRPAFPRAAGVGG